MIASSPIIIDVPKGNYDHQTQVTKYEAKYKLAMTMNGTQTFDFNGKPHDHDND